MTPAPNPPDPARYLAQLASTVKDRIAPGAAADPKLAGDLQSLSSSLRLLAEAVGGLTSGVDARRDETAAALAQLGIDAGADDDRSVLAHRARENGDIAQAMRSFVRADLARGPAALFDSAGRATDVASATVDTVPSLADPDVRDRLEIFLADALGRPDLSVRAVTSMTNGFAAETAVCTLAGSGPPDGDERVVVRAQWPQLLLSEIPQPVEHQARCMAVARAAGLPAPAIRAVAPSTEPIGAPIHVTDFVEGFVPAAWTAEGRRFIDGLREGGWAQFLDDLVTLHGAPWRDAELVAPDAGDVRRRLRGRLERIEALYRRAELRPDPVVEYTFGWLETRIDQWGDEVLIHGDYRPGNILYGADGSVRALIDWDAGKVTDVHEELGQLTMWAYRDRSGLACGLLPDERLVSEYEARSGRRIDPAGLRYYQVLMTLQHLLVFTILARSFLDHGGDVRSARALFTLVDARKVLADLTGLSDAQVDR